jgi:hypothetical protein
MLRRLAYVSTPAPAFRAVEVGHIIEVSRANNAAAGITGVLVYTGTDFAQLIEGEADAVGRLWGKLRSDRRHTDLAVFLDEPADRVWFESWRMGYLYDEALTTQIFEWRVLQRRLDDIEIEGMRLLLASADAA